MGPRRSASAPPPTYFVGRRIRPRAGTSYDSEAPPGGRGQAHFSANPSATSTVMTSPATAAPEGGAGTQERTAAHHMTSRFGMATLGSDSGGRPGGMLGGFARVTFAVGTVKHRSARVIPVRSLDGIIPWCVGDKFRRV